MEDREAFRHAGCMPVTTQVPATKTPSCLRQAGIII